MKLVIYHETFKRSKRGGWDIMLTVLTKNEAWILCMYRHTKSEEEVLRTMKHSWLNDQNHPETRCLAGSNFFSASPPPTILVLLRSLILSFILFMQVLSPTEPRAPNSCQQMYRVISKAQILLLPPAALWPHRHWECMEVHFRSRC